MWFDKVVKDGKAQGVWFVFFYNRKCDICQKFKPEFERIAAELHNLASFGMLEIVDSEELRDTYGIKYAPYLAFVKDDKIYDYDNARKLEAVRNFITKDHIGSQKTKKIRDRRTTTQTYFAKLETFVEHNMPQWNRQLDNGGFRALGLSHLPGEYKLIMAIFGLWLVTMAALIVLDLLVFKIFLKSSRSRKVEVVAAAKKQE